MDVLIKGFKTPEQAKEFVLWYCEQGEQDADLWFECQNMNTPMYKKSENRDDHIIMYVE